MKTQMTQRTVEYDLKALGFRIPLSHPVMLVDVMQGTSEGTARPSVASASNSRDLCRLGTLDSYLSEVAAAGRNLRDALRALTEAFGQAEESSHHIVPPDGTYDRYDDWVHDFGVRLSDYGLVAVANIGSGMESELILLIPEHRLPSATPRITSMHVQQFVPAARRSEVLRLIRDERLHGGRSAIAFRCSGYPGSGSEGIGVVRAMVIDAMIPWLIRRDAAAHFQRRQKQAA